MSEALTKVAGLTPQALFAMSLMTGAGSFAGLRLLREAMNQIHEPRQEQNAVKLMLPEPGAQPSTDASQPGQGLDINKLSADVTANPWWSDYAAMGVGLPVGFLGAKGMYDAYQEREGQKQIAAAKQQYVQALMQTQQNNMKMAEATPLTDNFCEAVAVELSKTAMDPLEWTRGHAPWMLGESAPKGISGPTFAHAALNDPQNLTDAQSTIANHGREVGSDISNLATMGGTHNAATIWKALASTIGIGALGAGIYNYHKKKEREQRAQYPTSVQYADQP